MPRSSAGIPCGRAEPVPPRVAGASSGGWISRERVGDNAEGVFLGGAHFRPFLWQKLAVRVVSFPPHAGESEKLDSRRPFFHDIFRRKLLEVARAKNVSGRDLNKMEGLLRVASFNVNGIRARMPLLMEWIQKVRPHILALQETKVSDEEFPREEILRAGYYCVWSGRKGFNGVAVLSLEEISTIEHGLKDGGPPDPDRLILVETYGLKVLNTYVPQGTAVDSEKFRYKLTWFSRLLRFMEERLDPALPILWLGDFNVAPEEKDVYDPVHLDGQIGYHPKEREALERIRKWGWVDVFRLHVDAPRHYTFWDYRIPKALERGLGWRVDHIWATRPLASLSRKAWIDTQPRKAQRPSDHAPILAEFQMNSGG
jgi:exodeoxyribonuclease-3